MYHALWKRLGSNPGSWVPRLCLYTISYVWPTMWYVFFQDDSQLFQWHKLMVTGWLVAVLHTCEQHVQLHNALCKACNFRDKKWECNEKCIVHHQRHAQAILTASSDDDRKTYDIVYYIVYDIKVHIVYDVIYAYIVYDTKCSMI